MFHRALASCAALIAAGCFQIVGDEATPQQPDGTTNDALTKLACEADDLSDVEEVPATAVQGSPPPVRGGTLKPGRYVLTSVTFYFPQDVPSWYPGTQMHRQTIQIADGQLRFSARNRFVDEGPASSSVHDPYYLVGPFSIAADTITVRQKACDQRIVVQPFRERFTATGNVLRTHYISRNEAYPALVREYELR